MTNKTEELRKIFLDVSEEHTLTEEQENGTGNLVVEQDELPLIAEIQEILGEQGIDTRFPPDEISTIVKRYFKGDSDTGIARKLGNSSLDKSVRRLRIKLHLFRERDFNAPFELKRLESLLADHPDWSHREYADELECGATTISTYKQVIECRQEADRMENTFKDRLQKAIQDGDHPSIHIDDGLDDAIDSGLEM